MKLDNCWFALYTKSRHEKFIHAELNKKSIESFLPLRKFKKKWSDRTVTVEEPLFKSYLFMRGERSLAQEALKTKGAVRIVSTGPEPVPVPDQVIQTLRNATSSNIPMDLVPYIHQGDRVYVRSGIFKGTEGFVIRKDDKKCRLVISIDALMASVSLEIDACLVEKS